MRIKTLAVAALLTSGCATQQETLAPLSDAPNLAPGELKIELLTPEDEIFASADEVMVEIEGQASTIGGIQQLDMMLVMDTSHSLTRTDPLNYRSAGAAGFVESLSKKSDLKIGVVNFDSKSELRQPLTRNRRAVIDAIKFAKQSGGTNIAAGILTAVEEFDRNGRPGAAQVMMLFTDGKSNAAKVREATRLARDQGITVQTLLLGNNSKGADIMREVAEGTGGSFVQIANPAQLPRAFMNMRTTGVESVTLKVNGGAPIPARLSGGTFTAQLPLGVGAHQIEATAVSVDEQQRSTQMQLEVQDGSCATLEVAAERDGQPATSLNERAVEIVLDASRSMWGQIDGKSKMNIAQETLLSATAWLPEDLDLALRAYGSESPSKANNCSDSKLLVPFGVASRDPVRQAIDVLRPKGQTPIAFALKQAQADFGAAERERTVVLVTDGIESCDGDPVAAAKELAAQGITIHLIGFGIDQAADEDTASLKAIATAGGGQFVAANNAEELREAIEETVGTRFQIYRDDELVAESNLGHGGPVVLPRGDYRLHLASVPPRDIDLTLAPRDELKVRLHNTDGQFGHQQARSKMAPTSCEAITARLAKQPPRFAAADLERSK